MSCPEFREDLSRHDINLLQETHLRPGQHESCTTPDGYNVLSRPRRPKASFNKSWGGVATIVKAELDYRYREDLSGPDFLVIQVNNLLVYNIYLLPETSQSLDGLEKDPCEALAASLAVAKNAQFDYTLHGDLNARTGSRTANILLDPERMSQDTGAISTRGRWLLELFRTYDIIIASGAVSLGPESAKFTSFQGARRSVIDYVACSRGLFKEISDLTISDRVEGYDHAASTLRVKVDVGEPNEVFSRPRKRRKAEILLPQETELDQMFIATLEAAADEASKQERLYGRVTMATEPVKVTVHGVCVKANTIAAASGAAAFWGTGMRYNRSARTHGKQSSPRAEISAVILALQSAPSDRTLEVASRSQYAIKSLTYYASKNAASGWKCENGDLLKIAVSFIKTREAPVYFRFIDKDAANSHQHLAEATKSARAACTLQRPFYPPDLPVETRNASADHRPTLAGIKKVSANLPDDRAGNAKRLPVRESYPAGHRGRNRLAAMQERNKLKLVDAPSMGKFWTDARYMSDPKPEAISVSANGLKGVFARRLNPPEIFPPQFDKSQHTINVFLASQIPKNTSDDTTGRYFSRKWTEEEIHTLKDHLRSHNLASALGEDAASYLQLLEVPEEDLAALYNECITQNDGPSIWFKSAMVGILKRQKPQYNPDSYRLVVLESCFLKGLTILIHWRLVEWSTAEKLIPPWQNGFRAGFRTNNNPFILRCAKEWAKSKGRTLHVAFVDFSNAFPSTDQATLWLKLHRKGMSGPIFDWLRVLYTRMDYHVRHGDMESEEFKALIGVLTGDPASPTLWNLFLADLSMESDIDDPVLAGLVISLLAQADDLVIMSLSARGLQRKLRTLEKWCATNFILINLVKTIILIFGSTPVPPPVFHLGGAQIAIKDDEKYVGVHMSSSTRNFVAHHYEAKTRTARYSGHLIFGLEDMTSKLTPKELKILYMARVDCHLIHGCEISPDSEDIHVKKLSKVQISFLRQMLNLHSRSCIAPLFTETGIMPLRARRLILTLRYLIYLLGLNDEVFARAALNSSIDLARQDKHSWVSDLIKATTRLPCALPELKISRSTTSAELVVYCKEVEARTSKWLQQEIDSSEKLYLLQGRMEPLKDKAPAQITSCMRHYLSMVRTHKHREAITSVLLSTHHLALEVLRYPDHAYPAIQREHRRCRFCKIEIESPEHAFLVCNASGAVVNLRTKFLEELWVKIPKVLQDLAGLRLSPAVALQIIVQQRSSIALVAKFMHDVLEVFYATPLVRAQAGGMVTG